MDRYNLIEQSGMYDLSIWDTSSITIHTGNMEAQPSIEGKANFINEHTGFCSELLKILKTKSGFFTLDDVVEEINVRGGNKKKIKFFSGNGKKNLLELERSNKNLGKVLGQIKYAFLDSKSLIYLDDEEQKIYDEFSKNFSWVADYPSRKLSDVDFKVLMTGLTLSQTRGTCGVVSNDYGILHAGNYLLERGVVKPNEFGLSRRTDDLKVVPFGRYK